MAKKKKQEQKTDERKINIDTFIEESSRVKSSVLIGPSFSIWLKGKKFSGLEKKTIAEWQLILESFLKEKTN